MSENYLRTSEQQQEEAAGALVCEFCWWFADGRWQSWTCGELPASSTRNFQLSRFPPSRQSKRQSIIMRLTFLPCFGPHPGPHRLTARTIIKFFNFFCREVKSRMMLAFRGSQAMRERFEETKGKLYAGKFKSSAKRESLVERGCDE